MHETLLHYVGHLVYWLVGNVTAFSGQFVYHCLCPMAQDRLCSVVGFVSTISNISIAPKNTIKYFLYEFLVRKMMELLGYYMCILVKLFFDAVSIIWIHGVTSFQNQAHPFSVPRPTTGR